MYKNIIYPSLKTFEFKPVAFQAAEYTPVERKSNVLLQRSSEQRQAARLSANSQLDKIRLDANKLRSTISPDAKTQQWFTDYTNRRINDIQTEIDSGNYNHAVELAGKLGSEFIGTQIQGRQDAYTAWKTDYDKYKQGVISGVYSDRAVNRWQRNNPVNYQPALNEDGTERIDVKGTYTTPGTIAQKMDWNQFITAAASGPSEERTSSGGHTNSDGSGTGASSRQFLTANRILSYFDELVLKPENYTRIESARSDDVDEYNELLSKGDSLTPDETNRKNQLYKLLYKEGTLVTVEQYARNQATTMINSKAYDYKTNPHTTDAPERSSGVGASDLSALAAALAGNNEVHVGYSPIGTPVVKKGGKYYTRDITGTMTEYSGYISTSTWN